MLEIIWGIKTEAILDVWSIEHFFSGVSVGTLAIRYDQKHLGDLIDHSREDHFPADRIEWLKRRYDLVLLLFLAYLWETLEHYLETGLAGAAVEYWFQGVEFWPNRLIADPLIMVFGYLMAKKWPKAKWVSRVFITIWLVVHIFVFPHSMYLHELF